jgi:hypothetical protein
MQIGKIRIMLHAWGVILQVNSEDRGAEARLRRVEKSALTLRLHC